VWGAVGLLLYFAYGYRTSRVGRGVDDAPELPKVPGTF
jgi:APA family basic amino acid/polyamine antiporter